MTNWHIESDYVALLLFIIMVIKNRRFTSDTTLHHRAFLVLLLLSILTVLIDILSTLAMNTSVNRLYYEITMTLYIMMMPLLAFSWYSYLVTLTSKKDDRAIKRIIKISSIPYICYLVFAAFNPLTDLFFKLAPDMKYSRGPLFVPVGVGCMMFYSFMAVLLLISVRKRFDSRWDGVFMLIFFLIAACSIWLQILFPGWLVVCAAYAVVYVFCDMTIEEEYRNMLYHEIEKRNKSLEEAMKTAENANRAKNEFISRMSHDIRTPMNGIIGMTKIAMRQDSLAEVRKSLEKIDTSSRFLLGLVNDILDMQKVDSGAMELHPEPYTMEEFNNYVDAVIKPLYEEKNQLFSVRTQAVEAVTPIVDQLRFNQIMFNLLSNAVKYTPEGGEIVFDVKNELIPGHRERITAVVSDNGIGISKGFQEVIFDQYTRERRRSNAEMQGTGLGLSIVKRLVDMMGGSITVDSEPGKGAVFTVVLDFDYLDEPQSEYIKRRNNRHKDYSGLAGRRILVCDDNQLNREIAKTLLAEKGMTSVPAENGQRAVELFRGSPEGEFAAILMDINMPVMNGYEATRAIRGLDRKDASVVPVIAMTADVFDESVQKCREAGMNGYMLKPIEPDVMFDSLMRGCGLQSAPFDRQLK